MLSRRDIIEEIESGDISIDPFDVNSVGPCSVDLHLSDRFTVFKTGTLIRTKDRTITSLRKVTELVDTNNEPFLLSPGQFILASTVERIAISKRFAAYLEGKSSNARLGIIVHAAGLVNPGTGLKKPTTLTLEIFCMVNSTIELVPGMGIIQISFHELKTPADIGYDEREKSRYVGLTNPRL
ncbi:MAG: dCTP deaminase [Candidatus Odinarchaeota archaeon]